MGSWTQAFGVPALLVLGACSEGTVFVAWPELLARTKSVVLAHPSEAGLVVYGSELEGGRPRQELDLTLDEGVSVELLELGQTLADLRLPEGPIPAATQPGPDALDLVALARSAWTLSEGSELTTQFSPLSKASVSESFAAFRAQATAPGCPQSAQTRIVQLTGGNKTRLAFADGEGVGLIGTDNGGPYYYDGAEARALPVTVTSTAFLGTPWLNAGGPVDAERLWFGGRPALSLGRLSSSGVELDYVFPEPPGRFEVFEAFVRGEDDAYVLRRSGELLHFDGRSWTVLHDWDWAFDTINTTTGSIFELSPGGPVCAAFIADTQVICHRTTGITTHPAPPTEGTGFSASAFVSAFGRVLATSAGEFFSFDETGFRQLGDSLKFRSRAIQPFREGFLVGGDAGYIGYFDPLRGACTVSEGLGVVSDAMVAFSPTRTIVTGSAPGPVRDDAVFVVVDWSN